MTAKLQITLSSASQNKIRHKMGTTTTMNQQQLNGEQPLFGTVSSLIARCGSGPDIIYAQLNWAWNFNCTLKPQCWKINNSLACKLSDDGNNCWYFNIYEHDKFRARLSWAWIKFFIISGSDHRPNDDDIDLKLSAMGWCLTLVLGLAFHGSTSRFL